MNPKTPMRKYPKLKSSTWLVLKGFIREAFSGRTLDVPKVKENFVSQIVDYSREMYCEDKKIVEEMLSKWDESGEFEGMGPEDDPEFDEPII